MYERKTRHHLRGRLVRRLHNAQPRTHLLANHPSRFSQNTMSNCSYRYPIRILDHLHLSLALVRLTESKSVALRPIACMQGILHTSMPIARFVMVLEDVELALTLTAFHKAHFHWLVDRGREAWLHLFVVQPFRPDRAFRFRPLYPSCLTLR